jgi:mRNA-degrading endonuclease toxin of MazEF toxin-antitoxin module
VPSLVRGRIVYPVIAIPDPQGANPKEGRPFVVISRDEDIKKGDSIQAVGITTQLDQCPPGHHVILPYGPTAKSGLKQKCVALCTWLIDISPQNVDISAGYIHPDLVDDIVKSVLLLKSIPQQLADDKKDPSP